MKRHAMVQAVSHRPLIAEFRVRSKASPCEICGGQTGTGTGVFHLRLRVALARTNGERSETFQKTMLFRKLGRNGYKSTFTQL